MSYNNGKLLVREVYSTELKKYCVGGDRNAVHTITRRKTDCVGHILRRNCFLKHFTERRIERRIEVTGRQGRRRKQLLYDIKEKRIYWILNEEALEGILWNSVWKRLWTSLNTGYGGSE